MKTVKTIAQQDHSVSIPFKQGETYYGVFEEKSPNAWHNVADFIDDERKANLFAAAPELLEALEEVRRWLMHQDKQGALPETQWTEEMINQMDEAIAKAKGE